MYVVQQINCFFTPLAINGQDQQIPGNIIY